MITSSTRPDTTLPIAAPTMTPTASASAFCLSRNSLNSGEVVHRSLCRAVRAEAYSQDPYFLRGGTMKVVRSSEVPWADAIVRGSFGGRRKALGGERISCGLWELLPGKRSFPLHRHLGTEEALFGISGRAKVRTSEGETEIAAGDFVSFSAGGPAHQLVNDGQEPFVYLAMSHSLGVDLVEYPDSGKVACAAGTWPNMKRFVFPEKAQVDYFEGEE
ncbi:MAG: cupin domain-containing protein [Deltaproteobacteria bacterium]|nr:MAG: cupin domain-containing protein [Deltaproteobacteria bacterium]